eukprot:TRINITY_DN3315_c0_g1_i3.p4 TRINITY_DN3315_c0_g1~~TRINITY_DN3315_c0_g1_i3.p4  ORF type:complete len:205 (+),score=-18.14 TRINITY_DN3315_c0_g1_i3:592-1206(+)
MHIFVCMYVTLAISHARSLVRTKRTQSHRSHQHGLLKQNLSQFDTDIEQTSAENNFIKTNSIIVSIQKRAEYNQSLKKTTGANWTQKSSLPVSLSRLSSCARYLNLSIYFFTCLITRLLSFNGIAYLIQAFYEVFLQTSPYQNSRQPKINVYIFDIIASRPHKYGNYATIIKPQTFCIFDRIHSYYLIKTLMSQQTRVAIIPYV